jgi:adsorption protein B
METLYTVFLVLAYIAAIGFLIFGLDDVFFDLQFLRYLRSKKGESQVSLDDLKNEPEQLIAIFIPAWMEGGVINKMAEHARKTVIYDRYDIFIGVYPNDPETNRCVDEVAKTTPRIHKVVTKNPGPTSKADCLNALYEAMKEREVPGRREYGIIALHDAEDILHPLTLKIYNHHVPRHLDMGQVPVFPLELTPWRYWVGNSYLDEFAEWHMKDMFSREAIGGIVPSAGVGTAFSRKAIEFLAKAHGGTPFQVGNLAEDYMVGLELCRSGFRAGFIDYPITRNIVQRDAKGNVLGSRKVIERVAIRENFPVEFTQAVKQKARWIIGTAFQGWEHGGWGGTTAMRYTLYRDRRAPVVHCINATGYAVAAYVLAEFALVHSPLSGSLYLRPLFEVDGFLWRIMLVDTALLVYRVSQKVSCVADVYGIRQGLYAIPRYPVVNVVNMGATFRAAWLYSMHRFFGKPLAWTKTSHVFPGTARLQEFTRSVEDMLVEEGLVSRIDLEKILSEKQGHSAPQAMLDMQLIDEDQFTGVWSRFSGLKSKIMIPEDITEGQISHWSESQALRYRAMPAPSGDDGIAVFGFVEPPDKENLRSVAESFGSPVEARLLTPSNFTALRHFIYPRSVLDGQPVIPLADEFQALSEKDKRRVRELQMTRRRSLSDAMIQLGLARPEEVRKKYANALHATAADFSKLTLSVAMLKSLGALFCEIHGLLPLNNASIGICNPVHPAVRNRIEEILGTNIPFCTDTPAAFMKMWNDMLALKFSEADVLEFFIDQGSLIQEHATRVREMQRLISGPVDRLLIQLGLVSKKQRQQALRQTTGLEFASTAEPPIGLEAEELLAPGFGCQSGLAVHQIRDTGITFRLIGLPTRKEIHEVMERCTGMPLKFELDPNLK